MITLTTIGITVLVNHCTLVIFEINKTILIVHITMSEIEHSAASELAVEVRILKLNISPDLTNLCLRWRLPDRNLVTAMAHWKSYRSKDIDLEEDTRDDLFITAGGPNYPEGRGKTFLDDVMKRIMTRPLSHHHPHRDQKQMASFLEISKEAGFPADLKVDHWMPGEVPAACYALINRHLSRPENYGGWQFPPVIDLEHIVHNAGISKASLTHVEFKEFTLDKNANVDHIISFINSSVELDEKHMPGMPMAFDIEEFKVCSKALDYLYIWKYLPPEEQSKPRDFPNPGYYESGGKNIISRILLGNGVTWMCSLRFPWGPETVHPYSKKRIVFRPDSTCVKEVFEGIFQDKTVFGAGVINDVEGLATFLSEIYDIEIKMPVPVETCALALAAGYRFPTTKLWFLQLLIAGGVHNKQVSCADNMWGLPWDELPIEFKLYALADVRHSYTCYVTLMALCIAHMFPDPVLPCEFLSLTQERCYEYLSKLILAALSNKRFNHETYKNATTRKELIDSLKSVGQSAKMGTPLELVWLGRLIPPWPTIPYGGARDLHTVAMYFAHSQADKLIELRESLPTCRSEAIMIYTRKDKITKDEAVMLTYERTPDIPATYLGTKVRDPLPCRQEFANSGYKVEGLATKDLLGQRARTNQGLVPGMLEWFRTRSIQQAKQFMKQIGSLGEALGDEDHRDVWANKPALYQKLKSQLNCRTNTLYETSHYMESVIAGKVEVVFNQETKRENKLYEMIEYHATRKEKLKANAMVKGRLPTSMIHLQGKHYKKHPRTPLLNTFKRRQRRMKEEDVTGIKRPINKKRLPSARVHKSGKPEQTDSVSKGNATSASEPNWSEEEHEVQDARSIITAKKALKPMTPEPAVRGRARVRSPRSPVPSTSWGYSRERSRSPFPSAPRESRSTTPKQRSTDMAERDSYRRLRRPVSIADYAKGEQDHLRYPSTPPKPTIKVKLHNRTRDREIAYEYAVQTGTAIPEEWEDPIPEPHTPTGYSDISSDDFDFRPLGGYGKCKGKGKNKKR